jgi:hypothetical protein
MADTSRLKSRDLLGNLPKRQYEETSVPGSCREVSEPTESLPGWNLTSDLGDKPYEENHQLWKAFWDGIWSEGIPHGRLCGAESYRGGSVGKKRKREREDAKIIFARIFNMTRGNSHSRLGARRRSHRLITTAVRNRRDPPEVTTRRRTRHRKRSVEWL